MMTQATERIRELERRAAAGEGLEQLELQAELAGAWLVTDAERALRIAQRIEAASPPSEIGATARSIQVQALLSLGRPAEAETLAERAVMEIQAAGADQLERLPMALFSLGTARWELGDLDAAAATVDRALALAESQRSDDPLLMQRLLQARAGVYHSAGDDNAAMALLQRAEPLVEALEDPLRLGLLCHNMGTLAAEMGDMATAVDRFGRAVVQQREGGYVNGLAMTLNSLSDVHCRLGSFEAGLERANEARHVVGERGLPRTRALTELQLGRAHACLGNAAAALEHARRAAEISEREGVPAEHIATLEALGQIYIEAGDLEAARIAFDRSLALNADHGDMGRTLTCLTGLARIETAEGRPERALDLLREALDSSVGLQRPEPRASALIAAQEAYAALGRFEEAHRTALEVREIEQASRARTHRVMLDRLRITRERDEAREHAREVEHEAVRDSEARMRAIVENTPDVAIQGYDKTGRIQFWNPASERMFGYTETEGLALDVRTLFADPDLGQSYLNALSDMDDDPEPMGPFEWVYRHKEGHKGTALSTSFPLRLPSGETQFICMDIDLTARKAAENALRDALAEVQRLKERLEAENVYLREEVRQAGGSYEIVGESDAIQGLVDTIGFVAPTGTTVLITGETGAGKELVARSLHRASPRSTRQLVKVDCTAFGESLIGSELFGHERGAFTGALEQRKGRFEVADGGTIFLDEIGELPMEAQAKLLRVLEDREFERVGSSTPIQVDVRVIAATNRDLQEEVDAGRFRRDLYYRLNEFPIEVPALRDRVEDLPILIDHFLASAARRVGREFTGIHPGTLEWMQAYGWPGNVRELRNLVARAVLISRSSLLEHPSLISAGDDGDEADAQTLQDVARDHILQSLDRAGWRIEGAGGAAAALGINASTLRSRMKKLGIRRP